MRDDLDKVKRLARDLRDGKEFPRSPRDTLAGYVLAARALDKCRAALVGWEGEYHSNCALDQQWLKFAGVDSGAFRLFVATGANDEQVSGWIEAHAKKRPRADIIVWNNRLRDQRLSDLSPELQEYFEPHMVATVPPNRVLYRVFDLYDFEEKRL
jgi:hypothetical protein